MQLPKEFEEYTRPLFGEERWQKFLASFSEEQPVSIRLNPFKRLSPSPSHKERGVITPSCWREVPWCRNGYYLPERPDFTLDPLLHAGCYYVQEAGSMFLDEVLRQILPTMQVGQVLDLCAAPGGKSTLLRAALDYTLPSPASALPSSFRRGAGGEASLLYSNEPDHRRANILMENLQKQGHPNVIVTNNYAKDYQKAKLQFDLILTDVPCSGEGMFRKDEGAIREWSIQNVMKCQTLQRSIVEDIWPCLKEDGILIYSTCTFNTRENEENVRWICEDLGAEILPIETRPEWGITGSLLEGFDGPVYRFIPGVTPTEGLFLCVLRKKPHPQPLHFALQQKPHEARGAKNQKAQKALRVLCDGNYPGEVKGKNIIPAHAEALLINLPEDKYPRAEVDCETALQYLRREAIVLNADVPHGYVLVCYEGHPLGFVKNLGNRANNLYPQEWRIRFK